MAIYHLSAKIFSRKAGRSSTGAAAYRAAEKIVDERTGEIHDYTRKGGVESAELVMPAGSDWKPTRAELWNAVEAKNKRSDAQVAREFVVALPAELTADARRQLAVDFAQEIANRYGVAADVAIHAPSKGGDNRNHHAHILTSTNRVEGHGFGNKARELDLVAHNMGGKVGQANEIDRLRQEWEELANKRLERAGVAERVDHRSLIAQGIDQDAGIHLGPSATAIERRGEVSQKTERHQERQQEAAGKVAAMVAIAEAQAKAAEQAADRLTAAAEAKEKDDRIRKAALAALARSSAATDRACAFAVADHAGIADNLRAASGDLGRTGKGAQRRVTERHYGRVVEAARSQFERVGRGVQQLVDHVEHVVRSVTAAAHQVEQQVAARLELVRQRAAVKPVGINPRSAYHPDNIAKREAAAAVAKPAPRVTMLDRSKIERRPVEQVKPAAAPSHPKPTGQEAEAKLLEVCIGMRAQWDAALVAEWALYLKELTAQAHAKAVAHVAEHQAHLDAKPMLFGRDKWEVQRQGFENRDTANNHEWKTLKEGRYPFLERDKEAVQQAVERRVSAKNPALAHDMPKVNETLRVERERMDALERDRQAQERAEKAKTQELDTALSAFKRHALKREMKANGYGDTGQQWNALPEPLRKAIEDFNRLPQEARPVVLARMRENMQRDPQGVETFRQGLQVSRDNDRGMSR